MEAMKALRNMKRSTVRRVVRLMALALAVAMGFGFAFAASTGVTVQPKQTTPTVTFTSVPAGKVGEVVDLVANVVIEEAAFAYANRTVRFTVTGTNCVLDSSGSTITYPTSPTSTASKTESFASSSGQLQVELSGNEVGIPSGQLPGSYSGDITVTVKLRARVTGAGARVTLKVGDRDSRRGFPIEYVQGYGTNTRVAQKPLNDGNILYVLGSNRSTPQYEDALGLIVNKNGKLLGIAFNEFPNNDVWLMPWSMNNIPALYPGPALTGNAKNITRSNPQIKTISDIENFESATEIYDSITTQAHPRFTDYIVYALIDTGLNFYDNLNFTLRIINVNDVYVPEDTILKMLTVKESSATAQLTPDPPPPPAPATGDSLPLVPLLLALTASLAGAAFLLRKRRRA